MERKYYWIIGIIIFGIIMISGCIQLDTPPSQEIPSEPIQDVTICKNLNGQKCFNNEECRGKYGPSHCSDGICTADEVFKKCVKIPEEDIKQSKINKKLCETTIGTWKRNRFSDPGGCECREKEYKETGHFYFIKERGCISAKEICEENDGLWKKPEVSSIENREDISRDKCVTSSERTLLNWDEENSICILSRINDTNPKCLINNEEINPFNLLK